MASNLYKTYEPRCEKTGFLHMRISFAVTARQDIPRRSTYTVPILIRQHSFLQRNIDKEFFLLFADMDENQSWYLQQNIDTYIPGYTDTHDGDFVGSNIMRCKSNYVHYLKNHNIFDASL